MPRAEWASGLIDVKRPTSLARFTTSGTVNKPGVQVEVQPGKAKFLKRAFLIKLRQGNTITDTKFNLGLAIRTKSALRNKYSAVKMKNGLYLLYGPSVDQAFKMIRDKNKTGKSMNEFAADYLEREFSRLLEL